MMKRFIISVVVVSCAIISMSAQESFTPEDNLFMNVGVGMLVGDNGQPSSISNVAVAWDMNIGYWFGESRYEGVRFGYTGDVLRSFNYSARRAYGWNTIYVDGLFNISNMIYKPHVSGKDPRWYCSPFISLECLVPMAENTHKTSFGVGIGIANEVNVHKNISVTLDWRNTLAMTDGIKWLPELNVGLKFYFTGKARVRSEQPPIISEQPMGDCGEELRKIAECENWINILSHERDSLLEFLDGIDLSMNHIEDSIIDEYIMITCSYPYRYTYVKRSEILFRHIKSVSLKEDIEPNVEQLRSYYELSKEMLDILKRRQAQLSSPTLRKDNWKRNLLSDLDNIKNKDIYRLYYLKELIKKVEKEADRDKPNLQDFIDELQKAVNTNPETKK